MRDLQTAIWIIAIFCAVMTWCGPAESKTFQNMDSGYLYNWNEETNVLTGTVWNPDVALGVTHVTATPGFYDWNGSSWEVSKTDLSDSTHTYVDVGIGVKYFLTLPTTHHAYHSTIGVASRAFLKVDIDASDLKVKWLTNEAQDTLDLNTDWSSDDLKWGSKVIKDLYVLTALSEQKFHWVKFNYVASGNNDQKGTLYYYIDVDVGGLVREYIDQIYLFDPPVNFLQNLIVADTIILETKNDINTYIDVAVYENGAVLDGNVDYLIGNNVVLDFSYLEVLFRTWLDDQGIGGATVNGATVRMIVELRAGSGSGVMDFDINSATYVDGTSPLNTGWTTVDDAAIADSVAVSSTLEYSSTALVDWLQDMADETTDEVVARFMSDVVPAGGNTTRYWVNHANGYLSIEIDYTPVYTSPLSSVAITSTTFEVNKPTDTTFTLPYEFYAFGAYGADATQTLHNRIHMTQRTLAGGVSHIDFTTAETVNNVSAPIVIAQISVSDESVISGSYSTNDGDFTLPEIHVNPIGGGGGGTDYSDQLDRIEHIGIQNRQLSKVAAGVVDEASSFRFSQKFDNFVGEATPQHVVNVLTQSEDEPNVAIELFKWDGSTKVILKTYNMQTTPDAYSHTVHAATPNIGNASSISPEIYTWDHMYTAQLANTFERGEMLVANLMVHDGTWMYQSTQSIGGNDVVTSVSGFATAAQIEDISNTINEQFKMMVFGGNVLQATAHYVSSTTLTRATASVYSESSRFVPASGLYSISVTYFDGSQETAYWDFDEEVLGKQRWYFATKEDYLDLDPITQASAESVTLTTGSSTAGGT